MCPRCPVGSTAGTPRANQARQSGKRPPARVERECSSFARGQSAAHPLATRVHASTHCRAVTAIGAHRLSLFGGHCNACTLAGLRLAYQQPPSGPCAGCPCDSYPCGGGGQNLREQPPPVELGVCGAGGAGRGGAAAEAARRGWGGRVCCACMNRYHQGVAGCWWGRSTPRRHAPYYVVRRREIAHGEPSTSTVNITRHRRTAGGCTGGARLVWVVYNLAQHTAGRCVMLPRSRARVPRRSLCSRGMNAACRAAAAAGCPELFEEMWPV